MTRNELVALLFTAAQDGNPDVFISVDQSTAAVVDTVTFRNDELIIGGTND